MCADHVLGDQATNVDVYETTMQPLVQSALDGYHCTAFAYGQTSSGKTHTILGTDAESGILQLAVEQLFSAAEQVLSCALLLIGQSTMMPRLQSKHRQYLFALSCIEIYNEKMIDLLTMRRDIKLYESDGEVHAKGADKEVVRDAASMMHLVERAMSNRQTAATNMNERSSRSHVIFCIVRFCISLLPGCFLLTFLSAICRRSRVARLAMAMCQLALYRCRVWLVDTRI